MPALKLLMVTFDLTETVSGDGRYGQADDALKFNSKALFRPVKQIRLIITDQPAHQIKSALVQRIGSRSSILISELKDISAWRIIGTRQQREWRSFCTAIEYHGITVKGLDKDVDSGL